jgi:hypothetical protein
LDEGPKVPWGTVLNIKDDGNIAIVAKSHSFAEIICCCHKN